MGLSRRQFVGAAAGTAAAATVGTTTAAAQSGPDYEGWFDNVGNYDGTVDKTGQDTVEITVGAQGNGGGFAFGPAAVRVSPGTEVVWQWTGEGGAHNVVSEGDGPLDSGSAVSESGTTYSHTFESEGVFKYACTPHKAMGMKGAVVVGGSGGGSSGDGDASDQQSASDGPDYGDWFDDVENFDGTTADKTGQDTVEITVGAQGNGGGFAFDPPAVRVSPGTEVVWQWTGEGGAHNVVSDGDGPIGSGSPVSESDTTYSHTFENEGTFKYVCTPHKAMGMKGAVVVESQSEGGSDSSGGGDRGAGADLSGPQWLLSGSIALAFFSPLLFAAALRRRYEDGQRETGYAAGGD